MRFSGTDNVVTLADGPDPRPLPGLCLVPDGRILPAGAVHGRSLVMPELGRQLIPYAELHQRWAVLSARYGLVWPDEVRPAYEDDIRYFDANDMYRWREKVRKLLPDFAVPGVPVTCLGAGRYLTSLRALGVRLICPLAGMSMRLRRQWLEAATVHRVSMLDTTAAIDAGF